MNELIMLIILIISFLTIVLSYILFDKRGFHFATTILSLITFILSFKIGYIFKMNVNLGIITLLPLLGINYIYLIKYGNKNIKDLVIVSSITNIIFAILLVILNYYIPSLTETISINIEETFKTNYKIIIMYPIIMTISEIITIKLFSFISSVTNNKFISILLTYILTAIVYTIIFYMICYINVLSLKDSIFLGITTYIIGLIIHIINILFIIYLTKGKKVNKWETYY